MRDDDSSASDRDTEFASAIPDRFDAGVSLSIWLAKDGQVQSWEIEPGITRSSWRYRIGTGGRVQSGHLPDREAALEKRTLFFHASQNAKRAGWVPIPPKRRGGD